MCANKAVIWTQQCHLYPKSTNRILIFSCSFKNPFLLQNKKNDSILYYIFSIIWVPLSPDPLFKPTVNILSYYGHFYSTPPDYLNFRRIPTTSPPTYQYFRPMRQTILFPLDPPPLSFLKFGPSPPQWLQKERLST